MHFTYYSRTTSKVLPTPLFYQLLTLANYRHPWCMVNAQNLFPSIRGVAYIGQLKKAMWTQ